MKVDNKRGRVLIVNQDTHVISRLAKSLTADGYSVDTAETGALALSVAAEHPPDVVLADAEMSDMDTTRLLSELHAQDKDVPVIVMTGLTDLGPALSAMRAGAEDYLLRPAGPDALKIAIERALERRDVRAEAENLRRMLGERHGQGLRGLVGASPAMQKVYRMARQVAGSRANVLITGENGTGKAELARTIHGLSTRANKPFVSVDCASVPRSAIEVELFGQEKGALTPTDERRVGRLEQADGGVLFLGEVCEIPALTQVRLLRVLQQRRFERLGGNRPIRVDARVIATTQRNLDAEVQAGRLRADLYYRLNVVHIEMPPLRLRGSDIILLAEHFVRHFALENHRRVEGLTERARAKLLAHSWPGNVRELENTIERAVVLCQKSLIDEDDLPFGTGPGPLGAVRIPGSTMAELERHAILNTLESCDGSTTRAADLLGISVRTVQYRLHEYGVARTNVRPTSRSVSAVAQKRRKAPEAPALECP